MNTAYIKIYKIVLSKQTYILWSLSFLIPFIIPSPQIITGMVVNCLLFLSVDKIKDKEIIPVIILPSLGAISHGILFGSYTIFLIYFLPFIWLGNYALVKSFSSLSQLPYSSKVVLSSTLKFLVLLISSQIYFRINLVPEVFVSSMGYIQLLTALLGGMLSYGILNLFKHERN